MRTPHLLVAPALVLTLVTGCGSGPDDASDDPSPQQTRADVVVPGRPGEPAVTLRGGPAGTVDGEQHVPADVRFLQDMVVHHRQAVTMASMAPQRAADDRVRTLAERIAIAQKPEIDVMAALLSGWGEPVPAAGEHAGHGGTHHAGTDHSAMPGMATPAQLDDLERSTGPAFDRLFLQLMTAHHEGALVMVETVLRDGADLRTNELATDIGVVQTKEIAQMQSLLGVPPGG